jgi:poly-beta-1,6-N-acetyl-D-glucosamine synthase
MKDDSKRPFIVAFIPAHNEEQDIAVSICSLLAQNRKLDRIVVVSDNSTDRTAEIASQYPVTVIETRGNTHRKAGALNRAWHMFGQDADLFVCIDGDTELPPESAAEWEQEFLQNPALGGSSSQPVMRGNNFLQRMQRLEFTKSATMSLSRGWCRVVSGTGCAFRAEALKDAARVPGQEGPWSYASVVEDYHLTYRLREAGWQCHMSPTVWCWTGSMPNLISLWHQRIKWTAGICGDLLSFGINRLNRREWLQQAYQALCIMFWIVWYAVNGTEIATGKYHFIWQWWVPILIAMSVFEMIHVTRMRKRDWKDFVLAGLLIEIYTYAILCAAWSIVSWFKVLRARMGDLWAPQYRAEGMHAEEMKIGIGS